MSADRNRNGGKDFSRSLPNRRFFPFPFKLQRYNSLVKSSLRRRPEDRVLATLQTRSRETIDTRMQLLDVRGPWGSKPPPPRPPTAPATLSPSLAPSATAKEVNYLQSTCIPPLCIACRRLAKFTCCIYNFREAPISIFRQTCLLSNMRGESRSRLRKQVSAR